jgi:hypothetical protein
MNRDAELLRQQRRAENASRSRPITQVATIGQRSNNGRYDVVMPDGGIMAGRASKIYNANHNAGDTVIALPRRDGVILLEGPKATVEPDPKVNPLDLAALVDRCDGYINGQIFNCAEAKRKIYGKLKILYTYDGALWIGGDRSTPKLLDTGLAIDSGSRLSFNNLGDGDQYILSGYDPIAGNIATIKNGVKTVNPSTQLFTLNDSATFRNLFLFPGYFGSVQGFGHGLFLYNLANLGAAATYWDGENSQTASNPDFASDVVQDSGSGNWWIAPGVSRPVSYLRGEADGAEFFRATTWGVHFASKNLESIGVWSFGQSAANPAIAHYIYRTATGQLEAFGVDPGIYSGPPIGIYHYPNWVGDRVYSVNQTSPDDFTQDLDRQIPIAIAEEFPGDFQRFRSSGQITTPVYAIPGTAVIRAYSYHP